MRSNTSAQPLVTVVIQTTKSPSGAVAGQPQSGSLTLRPQLRSSQNARIIQLAVYYKLRNGGRRFAEVAEPLLELTALIQPRGHERAAHPPSTRLLHRNRPPFRQQGHALAQAGAGGLRHPVPARRPWRAGDPGDRHAPRRHPVSDRADPRSGVGRDRRAPARGADGARHRQRHRRAELTRKCRSWTAARRRSST